MTTKLAGMGTEISNSYLDLAYDQWVALPVSGTRPSARYKHAAAVVDETLFITGGSRHGRYLSDIQAFDLRNFSWSTININMETNADGNKDNAVQDAFPAISGHSMIRWQSRLLLLAGHSKNNNDSVIVRFIDLESHLAGVIETFGNVPEARGGQSVSLVGSKLIMFGGEDRRRKLLNDVHVLDLETMTWNLMETTQTPPTPRFDHTAAVLGDRYLLIFGGCSHSIFFSDLHVLDFETSFNSGRLSPSDPFMEAVQNGLAASGRVLFMEWSQPQIQGDLVSPRAGHTGVSIDENWYIVGGGDNKSGATETLVLDMSKFVLTVLTSVKGRDPLASEGLSVSSASIDGKKVLVAFGGYNGKYNNEVFVMRPKPKDSKNPKVLKSPAAAAAAASVFAAYALAKSEKLEFEDRIFKTDLLAEVNILKEGKKILESSLGEVRKENSGLKLKLDETNNTHAELVKELHSVQGQLVAERSRCANLEAQISEIQKMLVSMPSIEEEVQALRNQKSAFERDMEHAATVQRQGSRGVFGWIAG